ncbi:oocyte zinc finger protein XlCOF8.4-like [Hyperolius riggenbachi]|uniref:oocyte zinc finger protein XlCOF8.4-like n=1 Tax=Hyperolius riggenbachi TaxID=752182 RepID=UPI0035A2E3EC
MDEDWDHMTESILNLTLEIIYLLTGEDYELVKKTAGKHMAHMRNQRMSKAFHRSEYPSKFSPSSSAERNNRQQILEATNKITSLLTGEVPMRCQDVALYFSMEEWEYLEEHKDLYNDIVMENQSPLPSPDGSSNRNPPERCPSPPLSRASTQKDPHIPHHYQFESLINIKAEEVDEEEEEEVMFIRDYWPCKDEGIPVEIGTDGRVRKISEGRLLLSPDRHLKEDEFSQDSLEEEPDTPNAFSGFHNEDGSLDHFHPDESSPNNLENMDDMGHRGNKMFPCTVCGKWFTSYGGLLMHQRLHTGEKPFSCSYCGKSFTQKGILVNHEKIHQGIRPFPCSVCGKCFAKKSDVVRHLRVHTGEKPFPCARCGKCFSQKSSLLNHLRLSICDKPFPCFICGKRFAQRSDLGRHQEIHRR